MNVNSSTDRYFLGPDWDIRDNSLVKSAVGTCELARDQAWINPLATAPAVYSQTLGRITVPAQLQKRRFYFGLVFDQVQRWQIDAEIVFFLNQSPVFTWPIYFADVVTRNGAADVQNATNALFVRPQDGAVPPYWVDVQRCASPVDANPVFPNQIQTDVPADEILNLSPLQTCSPINTVDSVWTKFTAWQWGVGISATQYLVNYTLVMYPTHLNLMCDRIEFQIKKASFTQDNETDNQGFILSSLACHSSRY